MLLFEVCSVLYRCVWIKLCERYDRRGLTPKTFGGGRRLMLVRAENWATNAREFGCGRNAQWHLVVTGGAPADGRVCHRKRCWSFLSRNRRRLSTALASRPISDGAGSRSTARTLCCSPAPATMSMCVLRQCVSFTGQWFTSN